MPNNNSPPPLSYSLIVVPFSMYDVTNRIEKKKKKNLPFGVEPSACGVPRKFPVNFEVNHLIARATADPFGQVQAAGRKQNKRKSLLLSGRTFIDIHTVPLAKYGRSWKRRTEKQNSKCVGGVFHANKTSLSESPILIFGFFYGCVPYSVR